MDLVHIWTEQSLTLTIVVRLHATGALDFVFDLVLDCADLFDQSLGILKALEVANWVDDHECLGPVNVIGQALIGRLCERGGLRIKIWWYQNICKSSLFEVCVWSLYYEPPNACTLKSIGELQHLSLSPSLSCKPSCTAWSSGDQATAVIALMRQAN